MSVGSAPTIAELASLREVAGILGSSYATAYSVAASGRLGAPTAIGRSQFYRRDVVERVACERQTERATRRRRGSLAVGAAP
jgi:hypothetical protein